ncbi:MAG: TIGR02221 family CRISPR-associated protein [Ignavibacteriales bacterium CG12_big_fil_rev_8_21_14_0_65_30_8]|nr:MAG: TIGR02221 family CRISPR-associated protein [Ignavibacteriales bacterium CG12_big_fil_rev_8_21_14_0_65_30_8]
MIAISFLGIGNYQEVTYSDKNAGINIHTKYFTEALNHIYKPEKIYLVMTSDAQQKHSAELELKIKFEPILIPTGKSTDEIWEMFSLIAESIPENSELIIDITHGFRSQPMLALSIAIFLRVVKSVKIKKIIYGAFEAKNEDNIAPIFNLTSFINLIDWSYATDMFIKHGSGNLLSSLLTNLHEQVRIEQQQFTNLKTFGSLLEKLTESLTFIRPQEVSRYGKELPAKLKKINYDIKQIQEVKPLQYLLEKIPRSFSSLVIEDENIFTEAGFKMQAEMIKYYLETQQYVQAITLSREFIVSLVCKHLGLKFTKRADRTASEDRLNEWTSFHSKGFQLEEYPSKLADLWGKIRDARNDINHAGMRDSTAPASKLKKSIIDYCTETIKLINHAH